MALTITTKLPGGQPDVIGGFSQLVVADVTFDNSYATGGKSLTAGDLGFPSAATIVQLTAPPSSGFAFEYDYTNKKLKAYVPGIAFGAAGALTLDDFPLSGTGATSTSIGLASTASSPVRFGPQQEVANAVNLSTVTVRVTVIAVIGI